MDNYKLNAAKIIAAQQKRNGARSPESDSNWDSSEPEDTLPHMSSEEEVSTMSSRSRGKARALTPKAPKQDSRAHLQPHKPAASNRLAVNANKSSPVSSIRSGIVSKAGVNIFVDRGSVDSSDEDVSVASRKSVSRKEEIPPYDFSQALEETPRKEELRPSDRPGKSRKGHAYDPSPDKPGHSTRSDKKRLIAADTATPDGGAASSQEKKWKVNVGFQADSSPKPEVASDHDNLDRSQNLAMTTMTSTASDVDLRKVEESMMGMMRGMDAVDGERYMYDKAKTEESHFLLEENTHRYIYHYQHGNVRYYDTRPGRHDVYMTGIADKSEKLVRRGVREVFAALRIMTDFLLILVLELLRFLAYNVFGLLFVGLLTTLGDYFLKPVLAALFNSVLQPLAVFLYNAGAALRTVAGPLIDILRGVLTQFAMLLRAFRLVEVNWTAGGRDVRRDVQDV